MLQAILKRKKEKPTGVTCQYCGWHGTKDQVMSARVMNTDSSQYQIKVCPNCQRNGGLVYHDEG